MSLFPLFVMSLSPQHSYILKANSCLPHLHGSTLYTLAKLVLFTVCMFCLCPIPGFILVTRLYTPFSFFVFSFSVQPSTTNQDALLLAVVRGMMCGTGLCVQTPDYIMRASPQLTASVLKYEQSLKPPLASCSLQPKKNLAV